MSIKSTMELFISKLAEPTNEDFGLIVDGQALAIILADQEYKNIFFEVNFSFTSHLYISVCPIFT